MRKQSDAWLPDYGTVNHIRMKGTLLDAARLLLKRFLLLADKHPILNFMLVGGIGFCLNMGLYYPLTLVFKSNVEFLGQHFYLPPFVISSGVAIVANYYMNKVWTFKRMRERSLALGRYLSMASGTLLLDMVGLWVLVDYGGLPPVLGAVVALNAAFVIRYLIAKNWVWGK